jgi:hypothetical protein
MFNIDVDGGTAKGGTNLCLTCTWAKIREAQDGKLWIRCAEFEAWVTTNTYRCNAYRHKNQPDIYNLKEVAWIVTPDPKGKVGFRPFKDLSDDEKHKVDRQL